MNSTLLEKADRFTQYCKGKQMKTLFTAFKGKNNTSYQLVSLINNNSLYLTNSFIGLEKDISSIDYEYDTVYMFGLDKNLVDEIRIETCAEYNGEFILSEFDTMDLKAKLKEHNIRYSISKRPTRYLCNAAYYHMLKRNLNTIFIHIPSLKGMSDDLMSKLVESF